MIKKLEDDSKTIFLLNEIWMLTFGGAFLRAYVYQPNQLEKSRSDFRKSIRSFVEKELQPQYLELVSEEQHILNIISLVKYTECQEEILTVGRIKFGVAQKIINLYLKYLWCLGFIPEPPHFPVDRIIQEKIKYKPLLAWTKIDSEEDYMCIINFAKSKLEENQSLAEYELYNFQRSSI